ncbi:hypothetical protein CA13_15860 [Planctomycetes bacterium CA13]|uniref:Uncharacterized protein n=1 Tax=Novipirellula herctigrandis TaxID=2527986 RepID=A0A5C5Z0F2_9BACT|nr:hypothetical protein CA13_15860 [Planctomycetes bacterium CA13]
MDRRLFLARISSLAAAASAIPATNALGATSENLTLPDIASDDAKDPMRVGLGRRFVSDLRTSGYWEVIIEQVHFHRQQMRDRKLCMPLIRFNDDFSLPDDAYYFEIYGVKVFSSNLSPEYLLSSSPLSEDVRREYENLSVRLATLAERCQHVWPTELKEAAGIVTSVRRSLSPIDKTVRMEGARNGSRVLTN